MILYTLDILVGFFANVFRVYVIKRWISVFFNNKDYSWKVKNSLYMIFCLETSLIYNLYHHPILNIFANITGLILVIYPYKARTIHKALVILLIYGINAIVDSLVVISFMKYSIGDNIWQVYECITSLILLLIVLIFEKTLQIQQDNELPLFYQITLGFIPILSIGIIYYVLQNVSEMKLMTLCIITGFFIINILIFYLYTSLIQYYSGYLEKKTFEQMVDIYKYQLNLVEESRSREKALRHDMKHHIIELKSMAKDIDNKKMQNYLNDMEKFMLNPKEHVSTGNPNIDGVLNYLLQEADRSLNTVNIKINIPEHMFSNDFKLCVIIGNLIDNAIQAAKKTNEKYLEINMQLNQGILFIFVENSYCGNIIKENEDLITTQKDMVIHGIGLKNVRKIIELYGGELNLNYNKNHFTAKVLLFVSK